MQKDVKQMTGSFGTGSMAMGAYLMWEPNGMLERLVSKLGVLAPVGPALPGLLMLLGTAVLGFALIRMQKG
jgi:hypothetical protein